MQSKKVLILIISLLVLAALAFGFFALLAGSNTEETGTVTRLPVDKSDDTSAPITAQEVAAHNQRSDCWTIINGGVYDITDYIPLHPGGDEILRACGNDATSLFEQRKTNDGEVVGSGTPHSSSAHSQLERYRLGEAAQ